VREIVTVTEEVSVSVIEGLSEEKYKTDIGIECVKEGQRN
jgi:hypothetical protein